MNGKGKKYYDNSLVFEGEILNGLKNGKCKEYSGEEIIFDGEYLNGKKWNGKGKVYNSFNKLIFEGE